MIELFEKTLKKELKIHAKALDIPSGAAEIFIEKTLKQTRDSLKMKKIVTEKDVRQVVEKKLRQFNADLAYVYKNRDKII